MKLPRVILFDVDGVLLLPPKLFGDMYAEKHDIDLDWFTSFFKSPEFKNSSIGKADLKDAIKAHNDKWQWDGDIDDLLNEWFETENHPNEELLEIAKELREKGVKIYIATQQEKYRADFLVNKVFKNKLDGAFVSAHIGEHKHENEYWDHILEELGKSCPGIQPEDILFFDDKQNLVDLANSKGIKGYFYRDINSFKDPLGI